MKSCLLIFIYLAVVSSTKILKKNDKQLAAVDDLIKSIRDDTWYEEEAPCLENTLNYLEQVKNLTLWAIWIWEANQNPIGNLYGSSYQMGNFDQCMNPPWLSTHPKLRTQYCTSRVNIIDDEPKKGKDGWDPYSPLEQYINTSTDSGAQFNKLYWGVCVPSLCSTSSVAKILKHVYLRTHYSLVTAEPNITVDYCQVAGREEQYSVGFYLFTAIIVLLLGIALASTIYQSKVKLNEQHSESIGYIVSKAFCLRRNYNQLVIVNPEEIHVMNGIRFLTASFIVFLHQMLSYAWGPIVNSLNIQKDLESIPGLIIIHGDVIVDTFFAMSGLLHMKGLMRNTTRQNNLLLVLWKRYLRLLGPLAITLFYMISVAKYNGSGPFWPKFYSIEPSRCTQTWSLTLLMLNTNIEEICHTVTWYTCCDYQLAIFGTVLFYFYNKNKYLGFQLFGIATTVSFIIPGFFAYWFSLPAMPFADIRDKMDIRHFTKLELSYTKSYLRANAYLVGVAMGYIMSVYKPVIHRRTISTKWSVIGTAVCLVTMQLVLGLGSFFMHREYDVLEVVIAIALNRAVWAFAVCCIIAFCEYGNVPIVSDFLSLPAFLPLSRLSYGMYLIHPFILQRNLYSARAPLKYDKFSALTENLGTVTTSLGISFAMWLLIEAPGINLSNALFVNISRESKLKKKEETIAEVTKKIDNSKNRRYGTYDDKGRKRNHN